MSAKLKDVANLAGVSISTVSRILNCKSGFSEETVERVEKAVRELMYRPSTSLRMAYSDQPYNIGIMIPDRDVFLNNDPTTSIDVNSLIEEFNHMRHKTVINSISSAETQEMIKKRQLDGVVLFDCDDDDALHAICAANKIPTISTNGVSYHSLENYVDYDNFDGAYQATSFLFDLGHTNIGFICGPEKQKVTINRFEGVEKAIHDRGRKLDDFKIVCVPFGIDGGSNGAARIFSNDPKPTALFCFSDYIALGALLYLNSIGYAVPEDVSIVGFDDMEISTVTSPALTTVSRFRNDIAFLTARSLIDLIESPSIKKIQILLDTELIIRSSCQMPRTTDLREPK